jgi:hypothetical protein
VQNTGARSRALWIVLDARPTLSISGSNADGRRMTRPVRLQLALTLAAAFLLLVAAPGANASLVVDSTYTSAATTASCGSLGSSDQNGVFYAMCGTKIVRWDKNGTKLADIAVPKGVATGYDVAPSPDGAYLYVSQETATPRRLDRQANGTYILDGTWKLAQLSVWNEKSTPMGRELTTDGRGDIYISNGSLTTVGQRSIAKYSPDGTFLTAFGEWGSEPGNWITNQDIAVSRDGRRVYVGENCGTNCIYGTKGYDASRITRYDFTPGGTYRFSRIISTRGPQPDGAAYPECEVPGAVHSGYSVTLDYWENLYVTSTTCGRIQMFRTDPDPAKDVFVRSIATWANQTTRSHYIAADWAGRIHVLQWNLILTPKTLKLPTLPLPKLEPLPTPDMQAPVIASVTVPATTTSKTIQVTTSASDDRVVSEMQLAHEDGTWGPWQPFASPVSYDLSDGYGVKGVYVRVRDMAGNESAEVYKTLSYSATADPGGGGGGGGGGVPDAADPVLSAIAVPALTATRDIPVTLTATDDTAVAGMRFANEDGNWTAWKPFAATSTWTLSANVGPKAVYAQVRDASGRESTTLLARTSYQLDAPPPPPPGGAPDTTAPVLITFTLPAESTTQTVTASLAATDAVGVAQVRFANEDGNWTAWQAWGATKQWSLTAGYGAKLVYAQVRDAAGNESLVLTAKSSFVKTVAGPVDNADPALTAITVPDPTKTAAISVHLAATDDVGVTQVRFANEDGNWDAWRAYDTDVPWTLSAGNTYKVVYAQVRDAAGRESNVLFARTQVTG